MTRHSEEPEWVLIDSVLHHVSDYEGLHPRDRPEAICPLCDTPVIMKLGKVRVHHYAHGTDVSCYANNPETALHLNTKFYLASELRRGSRHDIPLKLIARCSGNCRREAEIVWADAWDDVKVEHAIDPIRPDIALLKNGEIIAAIEVFVSHAVDEVKTAHFARKKLRWVEVEANENIHRGENPWKCYQPLPYLRLHPESARWKCGRCITAEKERAYDEVATAAKDRMLKNDLPLHVRPHVEPNEISGVGKYYEISGDKRPKAICEICGNETADWWYYNSVKDVCRCRECSRQGKY